MNKQQKEIKDEIVLELSFKLQMRDYRFRLATRRAWLVGGLIMAARLVLSFLGSFNIDTS